MRPLLAIFALALSGCLTAQQEVNDCLPAAIAAKNTMEKNGVPTKVLIVHWDENGKERGHAYAIFTYGKKWSYDKNFGSIALTSGEDTPQWEAWEANLKRGHRGEIKEAYYLNHDVSTTSL
jgi:hypothetical protein